MDIRYVLVFLLGAACALLVNGLYRRELRRAARRQRDMDARELAQVQRDLRRMTARCTVSETEAARRRLQAAWQAGVIHGNAMGNQRALTQGQWE